ncbi:MAG: GTP 3',8-cyclase MoaA [candidate division WOR-3 bacterium]
MILKDNFEREFDYLRISLTDRCNLRCFYCMPEEGVKLFKREEILSLEEIEFLVEFFYKNFSIKKVRFTGGEPLLRKGFEDLVIKIKKNIPEIELNITTNGILLKEKVIFLKDFGIKVNLSLDTLNRIKFKKITGFDFLDEIIEGLDLCNKLKIPLKINTVMLKGINDEEIFDLIEFSGEKGIPIRFIEYMPLSGNANWKKFFISKKEIIEKIKAKYDIIYYEKEKIAENYILYLNNDKKFVTKVGFISTITDTFCNSCSRLRITSDGNMVLCLFDKNSYNLKEFLRPEVREKELYDFILKIVKLKPEGFIALKKSFFDKGENIKSFFVMRKIGG